MKLKILLFLLFCYCTSTAQVVYEPLYRSVYAYLSRISQRGIINLDDVVQPIARKDIAQHLHQLQQNDEQLTPLEKKELVFYLKEYTQDLTLLYRDSSLKETTKVKFLKYSNNDRFRFLSSQDKLFTINFQPIFGYQFGITNGSHSLTHRWSGFWAYGAIGKNFGYSVDFRAHQEDGTGVDSSKSFTPETGVLARYRENGLEYSEVKATLSYNWKWGNITVGKDYMPIGYGTNGKIIISTKAPSFPLIRLDIKPVKWFSFNYAHIWLNSNVVDSTNIRASGIPKVYQISDVPKYMATHSLIFTPFKGLKVLLGESIIYNNQVQLAYMTPILFFRAVSHYQGELSRSNTVSNSQIFAQVSSRNHIPHTHLYASFFIDELSLRNKNRNQTAYNLGVSLTDFPIKNLFISSDYTRVRPYTYIHFIPAQTYRNSNYNIGHWIGDNADQWTNEIQYRIKRGLDIKMNYRLIRKGTVGNGIGQQDLSLKSDFLWGQKKYLQSIEVYLNYEIIHDLFVKMGYQNLNYDGSFIQTPTKNIFSLSTNYGF
ncbi:capsule assembly Wzi family protein [Emticicia sp. SJ17W-69]|uniref:capsule assembly Wzi family protein n=1 Tax=Emticicia sp. SJ17W-69 TaxID=3421657 RepID=UPI003EB9C21B